MFELIFFSSSWVNFDVLVYILSLFFRFVWCEGKISKRIILGKFCYDGIFFYVMICF